MESQGQSLKLATKLACSSDRSSYSVFIYLFIYYFSPVPLMWSKKKQKEGWHLSGISGVGPITAPSRTHALWHQVSLCALQTRPRPPGSPPRPLPPPGVTEKVRLEIIIPSFASHLATSQVRAEPRSVPKNSRGQARSSVCPDGPDEPGGGIYCARC